MKKPPKLPTTDDLINFATNEGMAKATIGAVLVALVRAGKQANWSDVTSLIDAVADGSTTLDGVTIPLAEGARRFIASLPPKMP